jgi:LDH2 family malate/lactate/ureidoglycolate dehydrogenase
VSAAAAVRVTPAHLQELIERLLSAAGADAQAAVIVAASLVASDLRGVRSHGAVRVPDYVAAIRAGRIAPAARSRVVLDQGPLLTLDGCSAFGQVAAGELADAVAAGTHANGICLGTLSGVAHVGRLGEWVERLAAHGFVALAWCNCGDPGGNVAPFGGAEPRLGTNPLAFAIPAAGRPAIVADFSTSVVAEGKVRLFKQAGQELPDGWIIDVAGEPSNDPQALYDGGAILPMGGHKGFALALLVEVLGGVLAGAGCASLGEAPGNGLVLLGLDPARGAHGDGFGARVASIAEALVATPPAPGGDGVVMPGDPERAEAERAERDGLEFSLGTWHEIATVARSLGVAPEPETP